MLGRCLTVELMYEQNCSLDCVIGAECREKDIDCYEKREDWSEEIASSRLIYSWQNESVLC